MEMGGFSSMGATGPSGSSDLPLHGLKFGKKIYFEDVGCPQTSSSSSSGNKKGKGVGQEQPSPRCQVEGCGEDLSGEKAYYCRHKVCIVHSKSPKVVVAGLEQRFCQQCSRFHKLSEFDQGKRSCRRRLAGHNERRRKPPPPMSLISHYGHYSSFHDHNGRCASLLVDFAQPGSHETSSHTRHMPRSGEHLTFAQCLISRDSATAPGRVINTTQYHPYVHRSAPAGMLFSNRHIPPPRDECLEVSHSSCALSLLSNQQPWGTCQLSVGAPVMPPIHWEGNPVPQPAIPASFLANRWGFKGQEACGGDAHEVFSPINMAPQGTEAVTDPLQLPGELELALQGSKQCVDQRGNGREYLQPGNQMHWSL